MKGLVRVGIAGTVVVALFGFTAAPAPAKHVASATHVTCGQTITHNTTLDSDLLDCPGDGIAIGADKITLDLNGHTVAGRGCSDIDDPSTCLSQDGIVNSAGHDRVVIENGTIARFTNGILISDGDRNQLVGLHITQESAYNAPGMGISMQGSDRSLVSHTEVVRGAPAILLSDSDRNTIEDSRVGGGVGYHYGDGVHVVGGSDDNRVVNSELSAEAYGVMLFDSSRRNLFKGNTVVGSFGDIGLAGDHNVITENTLPGGELSVPLNVGGSNNEITDNAVALTGGPWGIQVSGNRTRVESNRFGPVEFPISVEGSENVIRKNAMTNVDVGITVTGGAGNVVQSNTVTHDVIGISVLPGSTATVVEDNLTTDSGFDDGIHVSAPGTLIRKNVANDNRDLGIEAVEGVIDGGGNRASGNGNPLQCLNVVCK